MIQQCYFVTGTDTEVGKTFVSAALLARAQGAGYRTAAYKPVAAGAERTAMGLRNDDALTLMEAVDPSIRYEQVNPVCLAPAIAPHIAAREEGVALSVQGMVEQAGSFLALERDFGLIEGAGGWRVPINENETLADFAVRLNLPVILVIAMRLGCLNHAMLTAEAITRDGLTIAGWVANSTSAQPMSRYSENLSTLKTMLQAPFLGAVPYQSAQDFREAASFLTLPD